MGIKKNSSSVNGDTFKILVPKIVKEAKSNRRDLKITMSSASIFQKPQKLILSEIFKNNFVTVFWGVGKERNYMYVLISNSSKKDAVTAELNAYFSDKDLSNELMRMFKNF